METDEKIMIEDTIEEDFLKPTIDTIRKSIKGIDDSYSHFWDILAELLQNAVDAINLLNEKVGEENIKKGVIGITIDCLNRKISIYDSGIGFKKSQLAKLLTPFSTDKENHFGTNGEKGVGIDFAIFQSNLFTIKTKYYNEPYISYKRIENAKNWKTGYSETLPKLISMPSNNEDNNFKGTEITIEDIDNDELFSLNFSQFKFILRTKTAIGNVLSLFEQIKDIDVYLKIIDINGQYKEEKIPYKYWLPTENFDSKKIQDIDDFSEWLKENHNDETKKQKINNKILTKHGSFTHNGRIIKYWSCFVPSRDVWEVLSCQDNLLEKNVMDNITSKEEKSNYLDANRSIIHSAGIYSSSKGMPTGITTNHSLYSGNAGYLPHFFIIFEDASLKFDIGRKALHGNIIKIYEKYAKEVFNMYTSIFMKYKEKPTDDDIYSMWNIVNIDKEIDLIPNIQTTKINFQKSPLDQEASVVAVFYELIGRDLLLPDDKKLFGNLKLITTKYKDRYDLIAKQDDKIVTLEFKSKLNKILNDLNNDIKFLNELNYVVCWNVDDIDKKDFKKILHLEIQECFNELGGNNLIPIITHKLEIPGCSNVYIIDLKYILDKLEKGEI